MTEQGIRQEFPNLKHNPAWYMYVYIVLVILYIAIATWLSIHLIGSHITSGRVLRQLLFNWLRNDHHGSHFVLFLMIDHFWYFVCQGSDVVTVPELSLAYYGSTDQSSILCRGGIHCRMETFNIMYFSGNVPIVINALSTCPGCTDNSGLRR